MFTERKKEVINICLDHFIEKGLAETSTRSLSNALQLQNAGLYYYFSNKDEAVIVCAEEAVRRLEAVITPYVLKDIQDFDMEMQWLQVKAKEMAPTMRFIVSVCINERYKEDMKPVVERLAERYNMYVDKLSDSLNCDKNEIKPYVYMMISAVVNYMIFSEDSLLESQINIFNNEISKINKRSNEGERVE